MLICLSFPTSGGLQAAGMNLPNKISSADLSAALKMKNKEPNFAISARFTVSNKVPATDRFPNTRE